MNIIKAALVTADAMLFNLLLYLVLIVWIISISDIQKFNYFLFDHSFDVAQIIGTFIVYI